LISKALRINPFPRRACLAALWLDALRRSDSTAALAAAREYAPAGNFWAPLMLAVALVEAGLIKEAVRQTDRLLELKPDFPGRGRWLITRYVKFDDLVERVEADLARAGLAVADQEADART